MIPYSKRGITFNNCCIYIAFLRKILPTELRKLVSLESMDVMWFFQKIKKERISKNVLNDTRMTTQSNNGVHKYVWITSLSCVFQQTCVIYSLTRSTPNLMRNSSFTTWGLKICQTKSIRLDSNSFSMILYYYTEYVTAENMCFSSSTSNCILKSYG